MSVTVNALTEELKRTFGESLISVVLYGSAAAGDHTGKRSDYNVLVVAESINPQHLRALSKIARKWALANNPPPLLFTLERLRASTDIFPIELTDIRQTHKILYGKDVVSDLTVQKEHMRLELERELKGKLLQLRERYLIAADKSREVKTLLMQSLSTFLVLCRAALRLWQPEVPAKKMDAARELTKHIGFDIGIFENIERLKETGKLKGDPHQVFGDYLSVVETIADAVDTHMHQQVS